MMTRKMKNKCILCGAGLSESLFHADNMPAGAQAMPSAADIAAGRDTGISLELKRCPRCGLTQFDCEPVDYYRKVIRAVGLSATMQELRRQDYRHLIKTYGMGNKKWIECGCGNGDFLKVLAEFPVDIYGTEASAENVDAARRSLCGQPSSESENQVSSVTLSVPENHIMQFFPDEPDMKIPGAPFDVFLSFNFLEHQPDPVSMLRCMRNNLAEGGIGLITVPSFEYIIKNGRYYELIRDHIANYDLPALLNLCRYCGFEILEQGYIGIGDTLRVVVRKASTIPEASGAVGRESGNPEVSGNDAGTGQEFRQVLLQPEEAGNYHTLEENYEKMSQQIAEYMDRLNSEGRSIAMWGASHQGFTIAATTALKDHVQYIIDSAPFKQGLFAPASHLPIVPPSWYEGHPVDVIMIAAPGYIREIEKTIREKYAGTKAGVPKICDVLSMRER